MELLFERFLSEERGEWPDIDLDLPSGDQREKVIQYVYRRYGRHGAAMTANVITYRDRSACARGGQGARLLQEQVDRLAKHARRAGDYDTTPGRQPEALDDDLTEAGSTPTTPGSASSPASGAGSRTCRATWASTRAAWCIAAGRLDEVVPLEPATMPGRTVVQWDKDDCADLGIIKVDLLGLGMLQALEEAIPPDPADTRGSRSTWPTCPPDDPKVYAMLCGADTVGVFQVESRAQMAIPAAHEARSASTTW